MTIPDSQLDHPEYAAFAWARYRRLMRFMLIVTTLIVGLAFVVLYRENGMASAHLYIAAAIGIGFSMLLMSALMGLVFLSSGTGHDDAVADPNVPAPRHGKVIDPAGKTARSDNNLNPPG